MKFMNLDNKPNKCFFCDSIVNFQQNQDLNTPSNLLYTFIDCPVCGDYCLEEDYYDYYYNYESEVAFYLYFYNKLKIDGKSHKICILNKLEANKDIEQLILHGFDLIDKDTIIKKFPRKINERVDYLALALVRKAGRLDKKVCMSVQEIASACSIKRLFDNNKFDINDAWNQIISILNYLYDKGFIDTKNIKKNISETEEISINPKCWMHVESLEREDSSNKKIFIALDFHNTDSIRKALKEGIEKAGYEPDIIDEKIYNKQVVPEIFKSIRESKMLVMDVTSQNYGAYYEAGYALGLGKEVIITCKKDTFNKGRVHFDVRQKQCLLWNDEEDLTITLKEWIKALE